MSSEITLLDRLNAAVTSDIGEAMRQTAAARGLPVTDDVRGSVQALLMIDGARFSRLPNLQRAAAQPDQQRVV